ncbi:MAG: hypothetical protein C4292_05540, partial [Nitrososphaera sp.]
MACAEILADNKGYYAIRGVSEKASQLDIKKAYRRMAKKYHPDRNRTAHAEEMIKRINAAYEVLSDSSNRAQYDRSGLFGDGASAHSGEHFHQHTTTTTTASAAEEAAAEQQEEEGAHYHQQQKQWHEGESGEEEGQQHQIRAERLRAARKERDAATADGDSDGDGRHHHTHYSGPTQIETPKSRFHIIVEPSLCMAFGSCETLAPK